MKRILRRQSCWACAAMLAITLLSLTASTSRAQLFGSPRSLGSPLAPRPSTLLRGTQATEVTGGERYVRGNRSRTDFVGGDRGDLQGFVGLEQAIGVGRVISAVESLREFQDRSSSVNEALEPNSEDTLYYPRIELGFTVPPVIENRKAQELESRLTRLWEVTGELPISVSVVDRRAVLRGEVPSEDVAEKLAILLSFEPGIDEIVNELDVVPPKSTVPLPPAPKSPPLPPPPADLDR